MTKIIRYNKCAKNCKWRWKDIKKGRIKFVPFYCFPVYNLKSPRVSNLILLGWFLSKYNLWVFLI